MQARQAARAGVDGEGYGEGYGEGHSQYKDGMRVGEGYVKWHGQYADRLCMCASPRAVLGGAVVGAGLGE